LEWALGSPIAPSKLRLRRESRSSCWRRKPRRRESQLQGGRNAGDEPTHQRTPVRLPRSLPSRLATRAADARSSENRPLCFLRHRCALVRSTPHSRTAAKLRPGRVSSAASHCSTAPPSLEAVTAQSWPRPNRCPRGRGLEGRQRHGVGPSNASPRVPH